MQNSDLPKANSSASQLLLHPVLSKRKGQKLSLKVQSQMESFFNSSFEEVRIHIGPEAASIGAIAFACGTELYFAPGYYQPETKEGLQLLGHELTHIIQQREGRVKNPFGTGIAIVQDELLEAEADQMGFGVTYSPWLNQPLCGKQKSTIDTLSIFSKGVDGPQGNVIQCVLEAYKSAVQGSKGAKNIFKESTDSTTYFKSGTSTATQEVWKPVTLNADFTRYTEVTGGTDKIVAITPPAPTGWTSAKMVNARFGSGTQAIKALPDFMGLHMHVTSHRESNGYYSQFHVKFDFGTGHISLFYNFPTGAFSHYGQNERDRKKLIGDWSKDHSVLKFNTTTATFKSESDRIARDIVAILNAP